MTDDGLIFWMNFPSLHQADVIRSLGEVWTGRVLVATEYPLYEKRIKQGWAVPDFGKAELLVAPDSSQRALIVKEHAQENSVHVFCGLSAYPENYKVLKTVSRTPAKVGLFSEAAKSLGLLRTMANRANYARHAFNWRKRLDFVLGTGKVAVDWFGKCGFDKSQIYEFGYFLNTFECGESEGSDSISSKKFRIIYVGNLSKMKGIDVLINALGCIPDLDWEAVVIGKGPELEANQRLAANLGIDQKIKWVDPMPRQNVLKQIGASDLLVLPSRCDGWGAVVAEALSRGTPAIASSNSGASVLVDGCETRGCVFPSEDYQKLASAIGKYFHGGKRLRKDREKLVEWASQSISPDVAADYFVNVMNHVRFDSTLPSPPWR